MALKQYSDRSVVRILSTATRRVDSTPFELSQSHVALGRLLAGELLELIELEPCEILHPQGVRSGWQIKDENRIIIISLMRSGVYVANGVRELFQRAPLLMVSSSRTDGLCPDDLDTISEIGCNYCVIIDSVINTGTTLEPILKQLTEKNIKIFVLSLVCPVLSAKRLEDTWPLVDFLFARVSCNQYTGSGSTDTGNRLFGVSGQNMVSI